MVDTMDDHEQVESFDLGDDFEVDRVVIYSGPDGDGGYYAVPFVDESGGVFSEPDDFEATDEYVEAVHKNATVDGEIQCEVDAIDDPDPV